MAVRASCLDALMCLDTLYHIFVMTIKAEALRFRNEKTRVSGAVRIVADRAASRGYGTMHPFVFGVKFVAAETKLLNRSDKSVCGRVVTTIALFCGVRAML